MTRVLCGLIVCVMVSGCAVKYPIVTPPVPPGPESLPHPTREALVAARMSVLRAATDTITPTEIAGIEFCSLEPKWTALSQADKWVQYKVDGVLQPWPGNVVPTQNNCFMTPKAFIFPAGTHVVTVALVYPPGYVQQCAPGDTGCVLNGCSVGPECYGVFSEPLTVVSVTGPGFLPGAPPAITSGQVVR